MSVKILKRDFDFDKDIKKHEYNGLVWIEINIEIGSHYITMKNYEGTKFDEYKSSTEPIKVLCRFEKISTNEWVDNPYDIYYYQNNLFRIDIDRYNDDEKKMLVKEHFYKHNEKFRKLQKDIKLFESLETKIENPSREPIPEQVRFSVWRRDEGKCVQCGSKKSLEFDHIIPFSQGGSNTERNLQLLCEKCNRTKSNKI